MRSLALEVIRPVPLVIAHHVPGRDPPSLCLITDETSQAVVRVSSSQGYGVTVEAPTPTQAADIVRQALLRVLEDVSPEPLTVGIGLRTRSNLSSLQVLSLAMDAMLKGLQAHYSEEFDPREYAGILAGALSEAGLSRNKARSSSYCMVMGVSNVYSVAEGMVELTALGPRYFRLISEELCTYGRHEVEENPALLDMVAKISSLAVVSFLRSIEKGEGFREALRLFNGVWYILGADLGLLLLAEKEEAIITASVPERVAVISLVEEGSRPSS